MTLEASRRRVLAGIVGGGIAGFAGCAESASRENDTGFTIALSSDPTSTDSYDTWGGMAPYWTRVVEPLVWGTDDMQPKPWLAADWNATDDTTWVFELREGVRFHNGDELTADDVVHSFEEDILTDRGDFVHGWLHLEPGSVTKIDDYTVEFENRDPFPGFPGTIAHNMIDIQPPEADRQAGEIIGTGPFTLEEIENGQYVRVERFDDYWGGKPNPSELTFRAAEDETTRTDLLVSGDVDVIYDPAKSRVSSLRERDDIRLTTQQSSGATSVWINIHRTPTDDVHFRRALNYAISQEEIVETVLEEIGEPARGPISTVVDWAVDSELPTYERDRATARDLVDQSSYDGEELTCLVDNDMDNGRDLAQILQAEFDDIGVTVDIKILERASLQDRTDSGEFHLELGSTGSNSPAADYIMWENFHTRGIENNDLYEADGTGLYNLGGDVDDLIETGYQTHDPDEKYEAYVAAQRQIVDAAVVVPLYYQEDAVAFDATLEGIDLHPIAALVEWHDLARTT
ncbi:ABC transporter substrate-binding protein [Natronobacterium gregoryi]|uniref:ABC transporter substrate-binding protein n=2 Tax=Natronobacterium gregoryi TaxID=44930 RepID=L0AI94_NATGS|nr:ABC transporter substrate-binding protein [Natronobacterium gregoryi]AFZ72897.1 ABC-type dipeptide transport system, periplasmic component [Natronobacterium gregoryi SP2]ELY69676.1 extracellular solute-binding protein family 5 [Natronobacterium gregoryi SP2]PLK21875.1 ABC transporter substrate-binding protein [Natronobacterium gregoryi SP2]SFI66736.1 peptide/nickel transport system substrate-binding protein [Natronobacterium gregoryi]